MGNFLSYYFLKVFQNGYATTHEKLDKDRFRRDMGGVEEAYIEMARRLHIEE